LERIRAGDRGLQGLATRLELFTELQAVLRPFAQQGQQSSVWTAALIRFVLLPTDGRPRSWRSGLSNQALTTLTGALTVGMFVAALVLAVD